jgi:4'-phosphopantetheinyl transferase
VEIIATAWSAAPVEFKLAENEVVIWRAALDFDLAVPRELEATLSPDEQVRANRFHFSHDRARFIAGRGILRALLGAYLNRDPADLAFRYGPQGKPELKTDENSHSLSFNLSHKKGLAVYAFARGRRLGIDLESVDSEFPGEEIARRFFSRHEVEELLALPTDSRAEGFFLAWTRKEAYIKAQGQGLQIQLNSFDVTLTPGQPARFLRGIGSEWQIITFWAAADHPGALVCDGPLLTHPRFFSWQPSI